MRPERLRLSAFGLMQARRIWISPLWGIIRFFSFAVLPAQGNPPSLMPCATHSMEKPAAPSDRGEDLRSNYVGYDRKTYVEFDFAIGDRHYRIYRSPTQLLERQKGTGASL